MADRVARRYAPAVHVCAAAAFLYWWGIAGVPAAQALLTACAVLIITCPCALGLAVPAVQVLATGELFRRGILLKSATALERLAEVDIAVFDKTGTLTEPVLALAEPGKIDPEALRVAASLAARSGHPLARSLVAAAGPVAVVEGVQEIAGQGLQCGTIRLGSRSFAGDADSAGPMGPELWLSRPERPATRFSFAERLGEDATDTVARLRGLGLEVHLVSGDHPESVARIAARLGIEHWQAERSPVQKVAYVEALRSEGRRVLMVGDGLNDGPSLAAATVSASPASAADISQTVADVVFQGRRLAPVADIVQTARRARSIMRQNIAFAIGYNALLLPLALAGMVTSWLAAIAMSSSSLLVMVNSFRAKGRSA